MVGQRPSGGDAPPEGGRDDGIGGCARNKAGQEDQCVAVAAVRWQAYRRPARREALLDAHRGVARWSARCRSGLRRDPLSAVHAARLRGRILGRCRTPYDSLRLEVQLGLAHAVPFRGSGPGGRRGGLGRRSTCSWARRSIEVHIFVMTLGYSRRGWAEGSAWRVDRSWRRTSIGSSTFGGVAREILYDRMRTVMQGEREGRERWNPTFAAFARRWGFDRPRVSVPYRARTKQARSSPA